jgi:hypothetical protein
MICPAGYAPAVGMWLLLDFSLEGVDLKMHHDTNDLWIVQQGILVLYCKDRTPELLDSLATQGLVVTAYGRGACPCRFLQRDGETTGGTEWSICAAAVRCIACRVRHFGTSISSFLQLSGGVPVRSPLYTAGLSEMLLAFPCWFRLSACLLCTVTTSGGSFCWSSCILRRCLALHCGRCVGKCV